MAALKAGRLASEPKYPPAAKQRVRVAQYTEVRSGGGYETEVAGNVEPSITLEASCSVWAKDFGLVPKPVAYCGEKRRRQR